MVLVMAGGKREGIRIVDRTILKEIGDRFEIEWRLIGAVVRWFVPSEEIENADAEVQHRLAVANERSGLG